MCSRDPGPCPRSLESHQKDLDKPILGPRSPSPCIRGPNHLDLIYKKAQNPTKKIQRNPSPIQEAHAQQAQTTLTIYPRSLGPYQKGQNWPIPSPRNPILCTRSMSHLHLLRKHGALISKRAMLYLRPLLGGKTPKQPRRKTWVPKITKHQTSPFLVLGIT